MAEVRAACPADAAAIRDMLLAAFGGPNEADLVEALERDGDILASLVATEPAAGVIGHALVSRMTAPFAAAALAPVAVAPGWQRQGVGGDLVGAALDAARTAGCDAVFVLGDPAYYGRFGFSAGAAQPFNSPYAGRHFMAIALGTDPLPPGTVSHARAFG